MMPARKIALLATLVGLGWPLPSFAQSANVCATVACENRGAVTREPTHAPEQHNALRARLALAEQEIRQLQESLGSSLGASQHIVERFPPITSQFNSSPAASTVQTAGFQSDPASTTFDGMGPEFLPAGLFAAFVNFEQDGELRDELSDDGFEVLSDDDFIESQGDEVDMLADVDQNPNAGIGLDFNASPDFLGGLLIESDHALMKIGGYVKADLIHDFNPIDSQDVFDTTSIPVGAAPRENSRFHARQSRLNFDIRWPTDYGTARVFVESDFFGDSDSEEQSNAALFRLRHAYGKIDAWTFGQTWSTFADDRAQPFTLDNEGSASSISRRQALVRYTTPIGGFDNLLLSLAVENPRVTVEVPDSIDGSPRTESPDFIVRVRNRFGPARFQLAGVYREIGFQVVDEPVATTDAWGFNASGDARLGDNDRIYTQIVWGEGIGSYKGLPDVIGKADGTAGILGVFGWMVGWTHDWTENLSSNFTYSSDRTDPSTFQTPDDLRENTYLAVNLIATPVERVFVGVEYLYGTRENVSGASGHANRLQFGFGFSLP
jgi:hypothetical protein